MTSDDDAVLRMLAGASFGPETSVTLPSGETLNADEAQALTSAYAPPLHLPEHLQINDINDYLRQKGEL